MRVMNVCAKHKPDDGRVYDKISKVLHNNGFEVHNTSPNIENSFTDDGIYLHGFHQDAGIIGRLTCSKSLSDVIEQVKPDAMICHEPDALWIAYKYYKKEKGKRNIRLIFDCHEAYEFWYTKFSKLTNIDIINKTADFVIIKRIENIVKKIDAVTCVNQTMTDRYKKFNNNSFMIPSLSIGEYSVEAIENTDNNNIVYYGQFGNSKQIEMLIGAAKILKSENIKCNIGIIGGYHPDMEEKSFEEIATENGVSEYFTYYGWLPREDGFNILKNYGVGMMRFDSYVMPGNYAMPNKLFEYMANGLAILGCKENIEIADVVKTNNCGYMIDSETAESLANGIKWVLSNKDKVKEMRINALNASKTTYNWDNYGKILVSLVKGE